jgi:hypothetical protein
LKEEFPQSDFMVLGDFNIDLKKQDRISEELIDNLSSAGFLQQVTIATRITDSTESIIDLSFTNSSKQLVSNVIMTDISDHLPVFTQYIDRKKAKKKIQITKRWIKNDDYGKIDSKFEAVNWSEMTKLDLEGKTSFLISTINRVMDDICPVVTKQVRDKPSNHWVTLGIKTSARINDRIYRKMKKQKNLEDKHLYKTRKKILDRVTRCAKNIQIESDLREAGTDTRKLWAIINNSIDRKQCSHKLPGTFQIDNETIRNKKDISNAFNKYFKSIGSKMADSIPNPTGIQFEEFLPDPHKYAMGFRDLTQEEVEKIMKNQQPKLSHGLDTINNRLVK